MMSEESLGNIFFRLSQVLDGFRLGNGQYCTVSLFFEQATLSQ